MTRKAPPGAMVFDVFGTVVDWRTSIVSALGAALASAGRPPRRPDELGDLADRWRREGYLEPIRAMAAGAAPTEPLSAVLHRHLDRLVDEHGLGLDDAGRERLLGVWDRLDPWPDAVGGLQRLRRLAPIATLSNGTVAGLVHMARHAALPWDCVLSAELWGTFKPDPAVYTGAARLLGIDPGELLLVAAHPPDLAAARACGLRTAYVHRPHEWGPDAPAVEPDAAAELRVGDFEELAAALGA